MAVFVRAAMAETVAAGTDSTRRRPPETAPAHGHPTAARDRAQRAPAIEPRPVTRGVGPVSPYEGSFHPYGLKVLKDKRSRLRAAYGRTGDEQQPGDLDPHAPARTGRTGRPRDARCGAHAARSGRPRATSRIWTACSPTACPSCATTTRPPPPSATRSRSPSGAGSGCRTPRATAGPGSTRWPAGPVCASSAEAKQKRRSTHAARRDGRRRQTGKRPGVPRVPGVPVTRSSDRHASSTPHPPPRPPSLASPVRDEPQERRRRELALLAWPEAAGTTPEQREALELAVLALDLGRVAVSNAIWEKPGPFGLTDWERVQLHPYFTERSFAHAPALASIGELAGGHHERLDGAGYHRKTHAPGLGRAARILAAADCYQAMRERRPHRPALDAAGAEAELLREAREGRLCPEAVDAVLAAAGHRVAKRPRELPAGLTDREHEVLLALAAGKTNKEIAETLGISAKTAGHHVQHIFDKTGVRTRSAATVWAFDSQGVPFPVMPQRSRPAPQLSTHSASGPAAGHDVPARTPGCCR